MISQKQIYDSVVRMHDELKANRELLIDLDAAIGDGDHGTNMVRGFDAIIPKLEDMPDADIGAIFKMVGVTLVSSVGGASGPLYGTAFMRIGGVLKDKMELNPDDVLEALKAAQEGIQTRGKAVEGEKTMLDALIPAIRAFEEGKTVGLSGAELWESVIKAAQAGVENTKNYIATKGRASYLGERSIGHQDPGATSLTIMLQCFMPGSEQ